MEKTRLFFVDNLRTLMITLVIMQHLSVTYGGVHWQCSAYAVWEQFLGIAVIVTLLALFRNRFNRQGKLAKAMSDSS